MFLIWKFKKSQKKSFMKIINRCTLRISRRFISIGFRTWYFHFMKTKEIELRFNMQQSSANRMLKTWYNSNKRSRFGRWLQYVTTEKEKKMKKKSTKSLLFRMSQRWKRREIYKGFHTWKEIYQLDLQIQTLLLKIVQKLKRKQLFLSLHTWIHQTEQLVLYDEKIKNQKKIFKRLFKRKKKNTMKQSFFVWRMTRSSITTTLMQQDALFVLSSDRYRGAMLLRRTYTLWKTHIHQKMKTIKLIQIVIRRW